MASRKTKPAKSHQKPENKADSCHGQKLKVLSFAVAIIVAATVTWALIKEKTPSVSENTPGAKPKTPETGNETVHWQPEEQAKAFAQYAGSKSCRECHEKAFDLWLGSDHQLAERLPDPKMD